MTKIAKHSNPSPDSEAELPGVTATLASIPRMEALAEIKPAAWNPRQIRNKQADAELLESVKEKGVLQSLLVRPVNSHLELVCGTRRYEAAKAAGLGVVPVMVRDLSDVEALELQTIENGQREDVHPLEEAECYRRLRDEHHASPEEIAAKVGKSRTWVYTRIKLCSLGEPARKAFLDGKLDASTALLVARIADPTQQKEAAAELAKVDHYTGQAMSYRRAVEYVQANHMLKLDGAGFRTTDATLVPAAGPCSTCAKRTGNQRELFADVKSADVCTDPACYRAKQDAAWAARAAAAESAGQRVLAPAEAAKVFGKYNPESVERNSGFVDLDGEEWVGDKNKKWRAILGKDAPAPTLARDARGNIHELVPREAVQAALKATGKKVDTGGYSAADNSRMAAQDKKAREEQRRKREVTKRVLAAVVATATKLLAGIGNKDLDVLLRFLAEGWLNSGWHDVLAEVAKRRQLPIGKIKGGYGKDPGGAVRNALDLAEGADLCALMVEIVASWGAYSQWDNAPSHLLTKACELLKLNRKALEAQARKEISAAAAPKTKAEPAKDKAKPAKAKGSRR